jgi:VWFA-related protein
MTVPSRSTRIVLGAAALSLLMMPFELNGQDRAGQQQPGANITTLHSRSDLVIVDVVVTDKNQNPIRDLNASDFTLLEDNKPQQLKSFEEHHSLPPSELAKLTPMEKMPTGYFTNLSPAPANGPVNILLLDSLNTPMKDQAFAKQELLEYLNHAAPGTRIAIFGLTTHLIFLQGFTTDPAVLKAAVLGKKSAGSSPLLADAANGSSAESMASTMLDSVTGEPGTAQIVANTQQFMAMQEAFQLSLRAQYTLDAMSELARYLSSFPGRKNLIWFSGSFPLNILPNGDLADPFSVVADSEDEYRATTNLLARSQVAVYPIDARGLMPTPILDASVSGSTSAKSFAAAQGKFFSDTAAEQGTMNRMAEDTGGRAFLNTNALSTAVAKAIEAGSNYYTLTYSPSDKDWRGQYRKIQVKVDRPGMSLSYRQGYFADDPERPVKAGKETSATAPTHTTMGVAMKRGAPDPTEILFEARIFPAGTATQDAIAKGNIVNPDPKARVKGPYRDFTVDFAADPKSIQYTPAGNGGYSCAVEFVTFVLDSDGVVINTAVSQIKTTLTPERYKMVHDVGVRYHEEISVPVKGEYFIRAAVHDLTSDKVGAIEVPVASVAHLTLPAASGNPAPPTK